MKRSVSFLLVAACIAGWAASVHLFRMRADTERRIEESVLRQMEEIWDIDRYVKYQIESHEKASSLILQQDFQNEIQDYVADALEESEQRRGALKDDLEGALRERSEEHARREDELGALLARADERIESARAREEDDRRSVALFRDELTLSSERSNTALADLDAGIKRVESESKAMHDGLSASTGKKFASLDKRMKALETKLDSLGRLVAECERKVSVHDAHHREEAGSSALKDVSNE